MSNGKGDKRRPTNEPAYRQNHGNIFGDPIPVELRPYDTEPTCHRKKSILGSGSRDFIASALGFAKLFK